MIDSNYYWMTRNSTMSSKCCCSNSSLSYYLSCLKTTRMTNRYWNLNYCFPHSIGSQ